MVYDGLIACRIQPSDALPATSAFKSQAYCTRPYVPPEYEENIEKRLSRTHDWDLAVLASYKPNNAIYMLGMVCFQVRCTLVRLVTRFLISAQEVWCSSFCPRPDALILVWSSNPPFFLNVHSSVVQPSKGTDRPKG